MNKLWKLLRDHSVRISLNVGIIGWFAGCGFSICIKPGELQSGKYIGTLFNLQSLYKLQHILWAWTTASNGDT